jgi:hypothetical protein
MLVSTSVSERHSRLRLPVHRQHLSYRRRVLSKPLRKMVNAVQIFVVSG